MRVHQILKSKPPGAVITVKPEATLRDTVEVLASHKIGAVVVSPDEKTAVGILSERDIVRELAKLGAACLDEVVGDVMTSKLVTCQPDQMSDEVFRLMTDGRFRHLPVISDGEMVGLISIGDVVKAQLSELSMEKSALEGMIMGH